MRELFEEDEEEVIEVADGFEEVEIETDFTESLSSSLDARRKLEHMLEKKRLRDELDDFLEE
jgi:hypothetical protein